LTVATMLLAGVAGTAIAADPALNAFTATPGPRRC